MPLRPPGRSFAVIARLVLDNGAEEWRPVKAVRWTAEHVLVHGQAEDLGGDFYAWLVADDVARVIRPQTPGPSSSGPSS